MRPNHPPAPPVPKNYDNWTEWFIVHGECNDFKNVRRLGLNDDDAEHIGTWAAIDYDKLRLEVQQLRDRVAELELQCAPNPECRNTACPLK